MTVHSKDGTTWKTKLNRIGQLSMRDKDLVFNNLGQLITVEMLKDLYKQLESKKAVGIDEVTKEEYGQNLEKNLLNLVQRIRKGTYKPKPVRIVEIPKDNGDKRPLAISCFEDKLVQSAAAEILNAIYEPLFLPCSFGFRPGLNCHEALRALNKHTYLNKEGACLEIDIRQCFQSIPHQGLRDFLKRKISDKRFVKFLSILMKPSILKGKEVVRNKQGCPQGSIVSPILSNIYLHYVIDDWFEVLRKEHFKGYAAEVRYADDVTFIFANPQEAEKFYKVLPKRLQKFGLEVEMDKSQLIPAGHKEAVKAAAEGRWLPTFKFLGFVCYWGKTRKGLWRLKYTSRADRFTAKLKELRQYLRKNLNTQDTSQVLQSVIRVVRGWIQYHAISDNDKRVSSFIYHCKRILLTWFRRKGGKRLLSWNRFCLILKRINFPEKWKTVSMFPKKVAQ
jgi:RNA-directed DNA polymerase